MAAISDEAIPAPLRTVLRGVGQVFFQDNALSGICFLLGLLVSSPLMALGALIGAVLGAITARLLKYDEAEIAAGLYGFNATLVGIATLFFFRPTAVSLLLLVVGCIAATPVTWLARRYVPFPTYTTPFIVLTWILFGLGQAIGLPRVPAGSALDSVGYLGATFHGIGQVMFQASIWTGLLFLIGIAVSHWQHAAWVLAGAFLGALAGSYHVTATARALDPERLVDRAMTENIALGLYGYNATLAAVALYLWRKSLIPPLLGIVLSVVITELIPLLGIPALTAPFVLATWVVLALGWLDRQLHREPATPAPRVSRPEDVSAAAP